MRVRCRRFSIPMREARMGAVAADAYEAQWTCQGCGRRERHRHVPPDGWTPVTIGAAGFIGYRCPSCIERKAKRAAKYRNIAEIRRLREEKEQELALLST